MATSEEVVSIKRDMVDPELPDPFWTEDYSILFRGDRFHEFMPSKDMSETERLNAIARFAIYTGIITSMYLKQAFPMYLSIFALGFTLFVYENKMESSDRITKSDLSESFKSYPLPNNAVNPFKRRLLMSNNSDETGEENNTFTPPTLNNPFGNALQYQQGDNPTRGPALNIEDTIDQKGVLPEINDYFNHNLYKDVSDIWSKNNSQREFYTMPWTTYPNKQGELAEWLYGNMSSCKSDQYDCNPYEDLRRKRFVYPFPSENPTVSRKKDQFRIPTNNTQA